PLPLVKARDQVFRNGAPAAFPSSRRLQLPPRLLQPELHVHVSIHRHPNREVLLRLLALARATVEFAEAEMAVGDEWAHSKDVIGCEGFAVLSLGLHKRTAITLGGDLPKKLLDLRHVAALTLSTAQVKRPRRAGGGLFAAPAVEIGLSQQDQREGI